MCSELGNADHPAKQNVAHSKQYWVDTLSESIILITLHTDILLHHLCIFL